jgi:hypothetical protein
MEVIAMSQAILQEMTVVQLVKTFFKRWQSFSWSSHSSRDDSRSAGQDLPTFYGTRNFITVFTGMTSPSGPTLIDHISLRPKLIQHFHLKQGHPNSICSSWHVIVISIHYVIRMYYRIHPSSALRFHALITIIVECKSWLSLMFMDPCIVL